jgi:hypothetical protein
MTGYFYWPDTGAKFYVPRGCAWGKEMEAEGWIWIEDTSPNGENND